jgi:hypothetical protein
MDYGLVSHTQKAIRGEIADIEAVSTGGRAKCLPNSLKTGIVSYPSVQRAHVPQKSTNIVITKRNSVRVLLNEGPGADSGTTIHNVDRVLDMLHSGAARGIVQLMPVAGCVARNVE